MLDDGHPELNADPSARERLRREALAAAALDHPFICKIHEVGDADGRLFIVLEYVDGETLQPTVLYWHGRFLAAQPESAEQLRGRAMVQAALEDFRGLEMVLHADLAERFLREGAVEP